MKNKTAEDSRHTRLVIRAEYDSGHRERQAFDHGRRNSHMVVQPCSLTEECRQEGFDDRYPWVPQIVNPKHSGGQKGQQNATCPRGTPGCLYLCAKQTALTFQIYSASWAPLLVEKKRIVENIQQIFIK